MNGVAAVFILDGFILVHRTSLVDEFLDQMLIVDADLIAVLGSGTAEVENRFEGSRERENFGRRNVACGQGLVQRAVTQHALDHIERIGCPGIQQQGLIDGMCRLQA